VSHIFKPFLFDLNSNFFDLLSRFNQVLLSFAKSSFHLLMADNSTELTPTLARSRHEEETICGCCPRLDRDHRHAILLLFLLNVAIILFAVTGFMYLNSEKSYPGLLCPDKITSEVRRWGFIVVASVFFLCLATQCCTCLNRCFEGQSNSCGRAQFIVVLSCFFFILFSSLLVCSVWMNFHGMDMIVQSSTNEAAYRCELDSTNPDAHSILFSRPNGPSNNTNQICEFWSADSLCDSFSFYSLPQIVMINGTRGAYRCQESSPEGHNVCLGFLNFIQRYYHIQTTLAFVSVTLFIIVLVWIEIREPSEECTRCCNCCCSYRGPPIRSISRKVVSALKDAFSW
jgi:hypothetical protein